MSTGRTRGAVAVGTITGAVLGLAGCGMADDGSAADRASHFYAAVAAGDGATACADLAVDARETLAEQEGEPCPEAVLAQDLPAPSGAGTARTYGSMAQVQYRDETVFLSRFPDGWRVIAAGCPPVDGDQPHRCSVEVG
ncbi:hypothetical protein RB608_19100 [Nocardioides sp. LHD-245]|uniref:hypothetical protein n=1 Tax=Nocardioides sp. LHD-245 TaxID=3051387 RepID=UPI0027DEE670|nr:hypothetical protein [Nocardioides sp. LHD-245]